MISPEEFRERILEESWGQRFLDKIQIAEGCWIWTACKTPEGYGLFGIDGKNEGAHRVSYTVSKGAIPKGLHLDHVKAWGCVSTACVNPNHLEAVTCRENLLRGDTFQAKNAVKTECPRGHSYSEENTYLHKGKRSCRACAAIVQKQPGVKAAHATFKKKYMSAPENRQRALDLQAARRATPEGRQKEREQARKYRADPAKKEKHRLYMIEYHNRIRKEADNDGN